ncbi:MAG TPA: 2-oxo acid dehydrogenase subunit E2 [Steroidobacteraceae bacterium]|nr:2-oxo acid dehydrogenase subunit E2 [Steroidobacteraceae bacterium]
MAATIEIRAPSEQTEGTRSQVQRWLKSVGDAVAENEPLIELETDKVTIEIPAPAGGVLAEILKQEQDEIAPGELLGRIQAGAESSHASARTDAAAPQAAAQASPVDDVTSAALSAHAVALSGGRNSPAVRRLLSEHKLHASDIRGSGAGGRITVDDVLEHVARKQQPASAPAREQAPAQSAGPVRRVPHTSVRKRIAERMVESLLHTAPHVTTIFEVDLGAVLAHRAKHRADFEQRGASLTLTAYFLAACVDAIREVPEVNSRWTDDALEIHETIDIGVATAVEGKGLVVPVVRAVQSLDLFGIAQALSDLVARAREDKLTPADVRGGTFTISNHGVSGSLVATPIVINQPQSAILGVGKLEKRAVVVDANGTDAIVVRPRCYVTLTLDHRVMDGHRANRFLQVLVERLERW